MNSLLRILDPYFIVVYSRMNLIFATTNRGKLIEAQALAQLNGFNLSSPRELESSLGPAPQVIEDAENYLGNAAKKAEQFFLWCKQAVVADDSGLEVAALSNAPGVLTARFAGPSASDAENRALMLKRLKSQANRAAILRCILYARLDSKHFIALEEAIEIEISTNERGSGGFGYDPIILIPSLGLTLAEIKEKNLDFWTHRRLAFDKLFKAISALNN